MRDRSVRRRRRHDDVIRESTTTATRLARSPAIPAELFMVTRRPVVSPFRTETITVHCMQYAYSIYCIL